ncbi:MAG: alpha amylase C-terminal domain-containing protein, partial [Eubacteriales bacterium]|nr:alpha amylase C-terminal domain-containing protein [Eubacteriales bacterium]
YKDNLCMHQVDFSWEGFNWIHHDDYTQSIIAFRRIDKDGNDVIAVCNFQPMYRAQYRIGATQYGIYNTVFNTDDDQYGGYGCANNPIDLMTELEPCHGQEQSLVINIPPMSAMFFKCTKPMEKPAPKKKAPAKKSSAKKAEEKPAAEKKAPAKTTAAKKAPAKKAEEKPAAEKKATAKTTAAKKAPAKKAEEKPAAKKKTPAKTAAAKKAPAKKAEEKPAAEKKAPAKKASDKKAASDKK